MKGKLSGGVGYEGGAARQAVALLLCVWLTATISWGQQQSIAPEKPTGSIFIRPYEAVSVPPSRLRNSLRVEDLIRGGKIYLTAQDAVALALENNIDLEIDRYNPLVGVWNLERAEAGGALPGVPSGTSLSTRVASGQGASGSQSAAGLSGNGNGSSSGNGVGATITQIGSTAPVFDPVFQSSQSFSHLSTPQANQNVTGVANYIQSLHNYSDSISQGLYTGGTVSLTYNDSYLNENTPSTTPNPSSGTTLQLQLQLPLLAGFGIALNIRAITVAKVNMRIDDLTFESQVMSTVANVLNLYYGLAADYEDVRAKRSALTVAQQFYQDNEKQVQIGTMAPLDVTTAEAQVATSQQDLVVSETTLAEQQVSLKNVLSRNGLADPAFAEADIVPLDRIVVPEQANTPPLKQLLLTALANRPDLAGEKLNLENLKTNNLNTENAVLPSLVALGSATNQGLAGQQKIVPVRGATGSVGTGIIPPGFIPCPPSLGGPSQVCANSDPYFVGGIGSALGQMIRRNFPTESVGAYFQANARNRVAQGDYAIDQLSERQSELQTAKDLNQLAVDVSNQVVGLQQARARYQAAAHNLTLQQQLLDAEQKKFKLGASTSFLVVQQQRDLAAAQSTEIAAIVAYSNAEVSLEQTLGTTLQVNHVSLDEAKSGRLARKSSLPEKLPEQR